jgi:hypothetical protein
MGNRKTGTLGKLSRRVRRNHERAIKARGKREKEMQQVAFKRGFNLGADIFKARILNATAGYEYEERANDGETSEAVLPDSGSVDAMSESTLGTVVSGDMAGLPDDTSERYNIESGKFEPASY